MTANTVVGGAFTPLNWAELNEVAATEPVIPDVLYQGEIGALVGAAGVGKSLLALDIAVSLARGGEVLGYPAGVPITVMYVDMENSQAQLVERLRCLGYAPTDMIGHQLLYFSFPDLPPLDTMGGGRMLAVEAERYDPRLIVFDSISRFVSGKEDAADTWQDFYAHTLIPLRRQGRTVLRLDHQGHDTSKGARGSSAKRDDVDVAWIMKRHGSDITLKLDKGRGLDHPDTIALRRLTEPLRHLPAVVRSREQECAEALDSLNVPLDAGRDAAGECLRDKGYQFSNVVLGAAIKIRREQWRKAK